MRANNVYPLPAAPNSAPVLAAAEQVYCTPKQAAKMTGKSVKAIRHLYQDEEIQAYKPGNKRSVLLLVAEVQSYFGCRARAK